MGQYWIPVNLDKREYVMPHELGAGLKLWEQLATHPGTGAALIVLCAAQREERGGGDFDLESNWHGPERRFPEHNIAPRPMLEDYPSIARSVIGRWAGDRIALVGDYAEGEDLAQEHQAHLIYSLCNTEEDRQGQVEHLRKMAAEGHKSSPEPGCCKYHDEADELESAQLYTDISDMVVQVIEHELNGHWEGEGWKQWVEDSVHAL